MSVDVVRGEPFEACFESGITGLVGTVQWMLIDNDGNTTFAATTADIIETPAGSGIYCINRSAAPLVNGHYTMIWSEDGTFDENAVSIEDLIVHATQGSIDFGPLLPADIDAPVAGPCGAWTTVEDIAACCSAAVGTMTDLFEDAAVAATQVLFELGGRQHNPGCERLVRPLGWGEWPCGVQILASGYVINWDGKQWSDGLWRIPLAHYPVTEVLEVKIDGVALTADEYRLDAWRWLTRMEDADGNRQHWPQWQRLDRDDSQEDTFSVTFQYGQNPPAIGSMAAAQLACEIYKQCPGNEGVGDCVLPKNATRVTKQGITIELGKLRFDRSKGWDTGMKYVDLYLNTYNPHGKRRRPAVWSPDDWVLEPVAAAGT